jgi:pyruvate formate lyase activating enzyme
MRGDTLIKGKIFNIQKYSIHDGPGIRTTVFLKGCPLNCIWCHNPESQSQEQEVLFYSRRCIGCGKCMEVCKQGAIYLQEGTMHYDRDKCTSCGSCTAVCYSKARELAGDLVDAKYVMKQIEKDRIFYEESGGGVTFSGGEPLMQPELLLELLKQCKEREIHTTIDTCGYASTDVFTDISKYTDLYLYDLKLIDDEKHIKYTGVSNKLILDNLKTVSKLGKRIFIRIPVIPGINDDNENIAATAEVIKNTLGIEQVNILPYHNIAVDKYNRLGRPNSLMEIKVPTEEEIEQIAQEYLAHSIKVIIGG